MKALQPTYITDEGETLHCAFAPVHRVADMLRVFSVNVKHWWATGPGQTDDYDSALEDKMVQLRHFSRENCDVSVPTQTTTFNSITGETQSTASTVKPEAHLAKTKKLWERLKNYRFDGSKRRDDKRWIRMVMDSTMTAPGSGAVD